MTRYRSLLRRRANTVTHTERTHAQTPWSYIIVIARRVVGGGVWSSGLSDEQAAAVASYARSFVLSYRCTRLPVYHTSTLPPLARRTLTPLAFPSCYLF